MLDNLTQREKTLALLTLALVPLCLLFLIGFWYSGKYAANQQQIENLQSQTDELQLQIMTALKANQRRFYYRSVSLPANFDDARNDYQQWLKQLVRNDVGMSYRSITPRSPSKIKHNGKTIGQTETFTLLANTDLEKLTEFLIQFYQVDLLHRINSITLAPKSAGASSSGSKIRTGELALTIEIEVLSLVDADLERDFVTRLRDLDLPADDYRQAILKRNIFGPANNTPTVSVSKSGSYKSGSDARITLRGKDADSNQALKFELLTTKVDDVSLEQKKPTDRNAYLIVPGQPAGEYEFQVRVTDSGFPPKSNEQTFSVRFKDAVVKQPPPPEPPKPIFKHARETRITAIVKDRSDTWRVWIKVRTTGDKYQLAAGESFELDDQQWTVTSIEATQATFEVEGTEKTFGRNQTFDVADEKIVAQPS